MFGGEGKYTYDLAKALSDLGHNVNVITTDLKGKIISSDFNIIYIPSIKVPGLKLLYFIIMVKRKIKKMCEYQDIDIIHHTNDYYFLFISKKDANLPIIATIHHPYVAERRIIKANGDIFDYLRYLMRKPVYFLEKMEEIACKKADKIIAVSKYTAHSVIKEYSIPRSKIEIIPDAVDINKFNPRIKGYEIRDRLNMQSAPIVLFVGRLDVNKGIQHLIKAFSKIIRDIPDAKLVIVGEGPLKNYILSLINKFNIRESVMLIGRVSEEDLPKFYAASDLVVLPSLMEGFGIVLLEAMASGKPCVATRVGGTDEVIINGETGLLVPPADSYSLCQAMNALLTDKYLSQKFGIAGRERAEKNFTWDSVAKCTVDQYKNCKKS
jgi:glycosyltransferase involved in cell wall biosynthesis